MISTPAEDFPVSSHDVVKIVRGLPGCTAGLLEMFDVVAEKCIIPVFKKCALSHFNELVRDVKKGKAAVDMSIS